MAKDFSPDNTDSVRKAVIIMGDAGVGKTLLAATSEDPYFLDVEGRAEHAHVHRFVPEQDATGWDELVARVKELKMSKRLPGGFGIDFKGVSVKTIVLDTVDRAQELVRMKNANMVNDQKTKQKFYGVLLDRMLHDLIWPLLSIPVNIIIVCHTAEKSLDPIETEVVKDRQAVIAPETTLALEGQLRRRLINYFDSVFHMVRKQNGDTVILTTSQLYEGRFLIAKDKRWLFSGKTIPVKWVDGKIETDAMKKVFDQMHLASNTKARTPVDMVKLALQEHAITVGIMKDPKDAAGVQRMKANVIAKLDLSNVTEQNSQALIDQGKELIDQLNIDLAKA